MLRGRRESSGGEESVRKAGKSPLGVRSPWRVKRGVFRRGVLLQEALLGVHRKSGVCQGSRGSSQGNEVLKVAEWSPLMLRTLSGTMGSPKKEWESPEGRGVP
jgi:hypothetical protein